MEVARPRVGRALAALVLGATIVVFGSLAAGYAQREHAKAGGGSGDAVLWVIAGINAVLVIVLIVWHGGAAHRPSVAARWRSRVADACARGAALEDAVSVAEMPGLLSADDASACWRDIKRRADDLARTLDALHEAARSQRDQTRVANVLASLHLVRTAISAACTAGDQANQAISVRAPMSFFTASLRRLREPAAGPPG